MADEDCVECEGTKTAEPAELSEARKWKHSKIVFTDYCLMCFKESFNKRQTVAERLTEHKFTTRKTKVAHCLSMHSKRTVKGVPNSMTNCNKTELSGLFGKCFWKGFKNTKYYREVILPAIENVLFEQPQQAIEEQVQNEQNVVSSRIRKSKPGRKRPNKPKLYFTNYCLVCFKEEWLQRMASKTSTKWRIYNARKLKTDEKKVAHCLSVHMKIDLWRCAECDYSSETANGVRIHAYAHCAKQSSAILPVTNYNKTKLISLFGQCFWEGNRCSKFYRDLVLSRVKDVVMKDHVKKKGVQDDDQQEMKHKKMRPAQVKTREQWPEENEDNEEKVEENVVVDGHYQVPETSVIDEIDFYFPSFPKLETT